MASTASPAPTTSTVRADRVVAGQTIVFGGKPALVESAGSCAGSAAFVVLHLVLPGKDGARPRLARWCEQFELA